MWNNRSRTSIRSKQDRLVCEKMREFLDWTPVKDLILETMMIELPDENFRFDKQN